MTTFTQVSLALCCVIPGAMAAQPAVESADLQLTQTIVIGRHNLRSALASPLLQQSTPHAWPQWEVKSGYLSPKGGILESQLGRYFAGWLAEKGMIAADSCPTAQDIYIHTNNMQRTIATGQYFALGAFPGCDVPVHHLPIAKQLDPLFDPAIRDGSTDFRNKALASMETAAGYTSISDMNQKLAEDYQQLATLLDFSNSPFCRKEGICTLGELPTTLSVVKGQMTNVSSGPIALSGTLFNSFILQYYEGNAPQDVAWGKITAERQWQRLAVLREAYANTAYGAPVTARHVSQALLNRLSEKAWRADAAKVTLLVGHDVNVKPLLTTLDVQHYQLPGQLESTPIGGKLLFQRWENPQTKQAWFKLDYLYLTGEQIRHPQPLSATNPPGRVTLALKGCQPDANGFCPWKDFMAVVKKAID